MDRAQLRTVVGNEAAFRQARDECGVRVVSVVQSVGGWRFVEEIEELEPAVDGLDSYSYWRESCRSGVYESEDRAWEEALTQLAWVRSAIRG